MESKNDKKKKIRQLESDIKEMQRDHAETFGYEVKQKKDTSFRDMLLIVAGIICLSIGLIWISSHFQIAVGFAVLRLGSLKFRPSVYSLPLMIGILMLILCKNKRTPMFIIAAGTAAAMLGDLICSDVSDPLPLCMAMFALTFAGIVLLMFSAARMFLKKS